MGSAVAIYILIGLAHWAAHTAECSSCRKTIQDNVLLFLQGVTSTFGWPINLMCYVRDMFTKKAVLEINPNSPPEGFLFGGTIDMMQGKDETNDEFHTRIRKTINEKIREIENQEKPK